MIDVLSALSLYRQLEALELVLKAANDDVTKQFLSAYTNQASFNYILNQVKSQCGDAPEYLATFNHIEEVNIPKGADRSVYPRFSAQVQMLKQAVGAYIEIAATVEQKQQIGFGRR